MRKLEEEEQPISSGKDVSETRLEDRSGRGGMERYKYASGMGETMGHTQLPLSARAR